MGLYCLCRRYGKGLEETVPSFCWNSDNNGSCSSAKQWLEERIGDGGTDGRILCWQQDWNKKKTIDTVIQLFESILLSLSSYKVMMHGRKESKLVFWRNKTKILKRHWVKMTTPCLQSSWRICKIIWLTCMGLNNLKSQSKMEVWERTNIL